MDNNKGLILVNTGNGKGKTTAALGLLVRAKGHQKKCAVIQFVKSTGFTYGEKYTLESMGVDLFIMGAGCTWETSGEDIAASTEKTWEFAKKLINSKYYDIIVLDELNIALSFETTHPLSFSLKNEVINTLKNKPDSLHIIITGRYAPDEIIDLADMVTEMKMIKHHYESGIPATMGIEF